MFLASPPPIAQPPLVHLRGVLPLGDRSNPSRSGSRVLIPPGVFASVLPARCRVYREHLALVTHGVLRELAGELRLDFELDPLNRSHAAILKSIRAGDVWGISPGMRGLVDVSCSWEDGTALTVVAIDQLREVSLTRWPSFVRSSVSIVENR